MTRYGSVLAVIAVVLCALAGSMPETHAQQAGTRWEQPVVLFDTEGTAKVFKPFVVVDPAGVIRVLWEVYSADGAADSDLANGIYCIEGDGRNWLQPIDVIVAPGDGRTSWPEHALDADNQVHLVWVGPNAILYYSTTSSDRVCEARSWVTTVLPANGEVGYADIVAVGAEQIHVAFTMGGGGTYYLRSDDGGMTWSEPKAIASVRSNAATAFPGIAVDESGGIHVSWEEVRFPEGLPGLGLFYAGSLDDGVTWSIPMQFADGRYTQPVVAAVGDDVIHLIWNGRVTVGGRYHQRSIDGGSTWTSPFEVVPAGSPGGQTGFPGLAVDSAGTLHLITGNEDTEHASFAEQGWTRPQLIALFSTFGNMEDQNITVSGGNVLHAVANARLSQIVSIRGESDAAEVVVKAPATPVPATTAISPTATDTPPEPGASPMHAFPAIKEEASMLSEGYGSPLMIGVGVTILFTLLLMFLVTRVRP